MIVETAVLDRDEGLRHMIGQIRDLHRFVDNRADARNRGTVRCKQRNLRRRNRFERFRQRRRNRQPADEQDEEDRKGRKAARQPAQPSWPRLLRARRRRRRFGRRKQRFFNRRGRRIVGKGKSGHSSRRITPPIQSVQSLVRRSAVTRVFSAYGAACRGYARHRCRRPAHPRFPAPSSDIRHRPRASRSRAIR